MNRKILFGFLYLILSIFLYGCSVGLTIEPKSDDRCNKNVECTSGLCIDHVC